MFPKVVFLIVNYKMVICVCVCVCVCLFPATVEAETKQ